MREIKFKAKRTDNDEWVYGDLLNAFKENGMCWIQYYKDTIQVIPETVCQFIGIKDKNGKDIYEHDNVKVKPVGLQGCSQEKLVIGKIVWINGECGFDVRSKEGNQFGRFGVHIETAKIIGNEFDGD